MGLKFKVKSPFHEFNSASYIFFFVMSFVLDHVRHHATTAVEIFTFRGHLLVLNRGLDHSYRRGSWRDLETVAGTNGHGGDFRGGAIHLLLLVLVSVRQLVPAEGLWESWKKK